MKTLSLPSTNQPLTRHDDRARPNRRRFPKTDYHFQETAAAVATPYDNGKKVGLSELRAFRKMSSDLMAADRNYIAEAALFALVTALVAWPIISMLIVLAQTARG